MASTSLAGVLRYLGALAGTTGVTDRSDAELLGQFVARRDEGAFVALLERHGPLVWTICRQVLGEEYDAEDAFQATFLVLARKAGSLRRQEALAAWLHRVALNVSRTARLQSARRLARERQAVLASAGSRVDEGTPDDWQALLHEEVDRLPERYRVPVVLCYFEGKTHEEAARQLGWPLGTVKGRLARARARLRGRLARRGVALSAAGFAALAPEVPAAVPPPLALSALNAALRRGSVEAAVGAVSPRVAALAEGAPRATFPSVFTAWALAVVGLSLLAGGLGLAACRALALPGAQQRNVPGADRPGGDLPTPPGDGQARIDLHGDPLPPGALARLGSLRFRHGKQIAAIALAPDGGTVVSVGIDGSVVRHDARTGAKLRSLAGEPSYVAVALTPDGRTMAAGVGNRGVCVREAEGKLVCQFQVDKGPVFSLAFSSDGRTLAGVAGRVVYVWDVRAGKEVCRVTPPADEAITLALSPDGKTLATTGRDHKDRLLPLCLWETATGRQLRQWQPHPQQDATCVLAFSPDGKQLATSTGYISPERRGRLRVWAVPGGEQLLDLRGGGWSLRYSPCGKVLAVVEPSAVSLREASTGKEIRQIPGSGPVSFAADGKSLVVADRSLTITTWEVASGRMSRPPLAGHEHCVRRVQFLPGGQTLASLDEDALHLWEVRTGKRIGRCEVPGRHLSYLTQFPTLSPDGKTLAVGLRDQTGREPRLRIGLWDTGTGKKLRDLEPPPKDAVMALAFAPDGKRLAAAMRDDRTIQFWDVLTGKPLHQFTLPRAPAENCLSFSPDGKALAVGDGELRSPIPTGMVPTVRMVDAVTGRELRPPLELPETAAAREQTWRVALLGPVVFSADGKTLAAALNSAGSWGREYALQVWEVSTGQVLCRLERVSNRFALSPDGKCLVTTAGDSDGDESPRLWEVATGKLRAEIRGHEGSVRDAAFCPDGRLLATGSDDTTVLVWDAMNLNGKPRAAAKLSPRELETLWADLAVADAARAYQAAGALVAAPEQAVRFVRERLRPAPVSDPERLARLVAELDANQFAVREKATRELGELGPLAAPALRQALAGKPSPEVRRRAEALLQRLQTPLASPEELQGWRAIEVLEHLGTPEAREALAGLAGGAAGAPRTEGAKDAVGRLAQRGVRP